MTGGFSPQDLECPDPEGCSVAVDTLVDLSVSGRLRIVKQPVSRHWFRVYDARDGFGQPNPGHGDTRFAPFDSIPAGHRVPTLYLAESLEAALLETTFHNVNEKARVVSEMTLLGKLHAQVVPPRDLTLVDLRDQQLAELGLARKNLASSPSEHYPCTRRIGQAIQAALDVDGMIWHSRQAELTGRARAEVVVVFADRVPHDRSSWDIVPRRSANGALLEGAGKLLLDELVEALDVTISVAPDRDG